MIDKKNILSFLIGIMLFLVSITVSFIGYKISVDYISANRFIHQYYNMDKEQIILIFCKNNPESIKNTHHSKDVKMCRKNKYQHLLINTNKETTNITIINKNFKIFNAVNIHIKYNEKSKNKEVSVYWELHIIDTLIFGVPHEN